MKIPSASVELIVNGNPLQEYTTLPPSAAAAAGSGAQVYVGAPFGFQYSIRIHNLSSYKQVKASFIFDGVELPYTKTFAQVLTMDEVQTDPKTAKKLAFHLAGPASKGSDTINESLGTIKLMLYSITSYSPRIGPDVPTVFMQDPSASTGLTESEVMTDKKRMTTTFGAATPRAFKFAPFQGSGILIGEVTFLLFDPKVIPKMVDRSEIFPSAPSPPTLASLASAPVPAAAPGASLAAPATTSTASTPLVANDWREGFSNEDRKRTVSRIVESLQEYTVFPDVQDPSKVANLASRFEDSVFASSKSAQDYYWNIATRLCTLKTIRSEPGSRAGDSTARATKRVREVREIAVGDDGAEIVTKVRREEYEVVVLD